MIKKVDKRKKSILAYIVGVALGDGNLSNPNGRAVRLRVSCDAKYPNLINNIKSAIQEVFPENRVSTVKKSRNCVDVSCYSNQWEDLLGWEARGGPKHRQNVNIPHWIFSRKKYLVNCLKGLIETDGSVYEDRGYQMMMFTTVIPGLAESFNRGVKNLGFQPHLYKLENQKTQNGGAKQTLYHVRLSKNVKDFVKLVKPKKF
jgi:LAGLIDADG-like domain